MGAGLGPMNLIEFDIVVFISISHIFAITVLAWLGAFLVRARHLLRVTHVLRAAARSHEADS
jgi:hypothetical protein